MPSSVPASDTRDSGPGAVCRRLGVETPQDAEIRTRLLVETGGDKKPEPERLPRDLINARREAWLKEQQDNTP